MRTSSTTRHHHLTIGDYATLFLPPVQQDAFGPYSLAIHCPLSKMSPSIRRLVSSLGKRTPSFSQQVLADWNETMQLLSSLFPHIMPIVFREMLVTYTGESALFVVSDQLLTNPDKWVKGRWKISLRQTGHLQDIQQDCKLAVPLEEQFRREKYKYAARSALYQEFKTLHKKTVDAVTAENNYSYTRSRPVLQGIEATSWRQSFRNLFLKHKPPAEESLDQHYMLVWSRSADGCDDIVPMLRETSDLELDQELEEKVLRPLLGRQKTKQEKADLALAVQMNQIEARNADSLYECECCSHEAAFEQIATCTSGGHISCFSCICRAVNETLYGQSGRRIVDFERGLIRCLAPSLDQFCSGCFPPDIAQRAITQGMGTQHWLRFESSIAKEALGKSRLPLVYCPFCPYAEIDDRGLPIHYSRYRLVTSHIMKSVLLFLLAFMLLPPLEVIVVCYRLFSQKNLPHVATMISISLMGLYNSKYPTRRFLCRNPLCASPSCLSCGKIWCDPHICHESSALSLRTTIESARTAALKRTCPRCGLGFIKESGCNKLTCKCGHTICYICRTALDPVSGGEAYSHFCQHFRPAGGKCEACNKCDLYQVDDEEMLIRRAGETAEREWREREGLAGVEGIGGVLDANMETRQWFRHSAMQKWMNWWVREMILC